MTFKKKSILIVGLFLDPNKNPITQASELANCLKNAHYNVLTVSKYKSKLVRLMHIAYSIIVLRKRYDISVVQFYSGNSLIWQSIACYLTKFIGRKLIITIHGGAVPDRIKKYPNRYLPVLKQADIITCPSSYIIDELKQYDLHAVLMENSIPLNRYCFFKKETMRPALLWMRGFSAIYNPVMALRLVKNLKGKYPDIKLYMGGPDMGLLDTIKELVIQMRLSDNVEYIGFLNLADKHKYAELADIYISTNKVDNAPVTFLEMAAMGLPIVSTNVGGVSYLVEDKVSGCLVNDDDDIAMAEKIVLLIQNPLIAKQLVQNARRKLNDYSEEAVTYKWDKLLTGV